MVITVPVRAASGNGPRPTDLNRDIPQVIRLLELVFGRPMGNLGDQLLAGSLSQPAFLWRLHPVAAKLGLGYVWEVNGRIVGNATLITSQTPGRFLIVNVAVHPDFRRRGIARALVHSLLGMVQERQGREVLLQVVHDNEAAISLYRSLHFQSLGSVTTWFVPAFRLRELEVSANDAPFIRELHQREWRAAYQLDQLAMPPELNWPDPLAADTYKHNIWRRLSDAINGRHAETWVTAVAGSKLSSMIAIWSEWARPHQVRLRVHPDWRGQLERPLLAKALRRLHLYLPQRDVSLVHPADDTVVNRLLKEANFRPRRTLLHMRLAITQ